MLTVRPARDEDFPAVLALVNEGRNLPFGPEPFRQAQARLRSLGPIERLVGELEGQVVGLSSLEPHLRGPGWAAWNVIVDREHRGRGFGRALSAALEPALAAHAPRGLDAEVRDADSASRAWAERRGFALYAHRFESVLDLERFDAEPHAAELERARASGLRFFTMAEVPGEEATRQAYEMIAPSPQDPSGPQMSFETFRDRFMTDPFMPPEGVVVAADGERWVGVSVPVWLGENREDLHTRFTGVDPAYRGRGLAVALKLLTVEYAKRAGAKRMRTSNDSRNAPILAVNRHLGYEPLPGVWQLERRLA